MTQPHQITTIDPPTTTGTALGPIPITTAPATVHVAVDLEQDWYFTFGSGHRAHALRSSAVASTSAAAT